MEDEEEDLYTWAQAYHRAEHLAERNPKRRQHIVGAMHEIEAARVVNQLDGRIRSANSLGEFKRCRRLIDLITCRAPFYAEERAPNGRVV